MGWWITEGQNVNCSNINEHAITCFFLFLFYLHLSWTWKATLAYNSSWWTALKAKAVKLESNVCTAKNNFSEKHTHKCNEYMNRCFTHCTTVYCIQDFPKIFSTTLKQTVDNNQISLKKCIITKTLSIRVNFKSADTGTTLYKFVI